MVQYWQSPRLTKNGRAARLRRFTNSFRVPHGGAPSQLIVANGSIQGPVTGNATFNNPDQYMLVNAASSNITVTLPPAADYEGIEVYVKITDHTDGLAVTVQGDSGETIDGNNTIVMRYDKQCSTFLSNGTNWHTMDIMLPNTQYSPTMTSRIANTTASPFTVTDEHLVIARKSSGTQVIQLPTNEEDMIGRIIYVKNISASANIQIQKVNLGSITLTSQYDFAALICCDLTWRPFSLNYSSD